MKKLTKTLVLLLAFVMACCTYVACGKPAVEIDISKTTLEIEVGESKSLTAIASDASQITWKSSDETVATVNDKGKVIGVKEGTATITAASGEATATCEVTVIAPVTVSLNKTTATVERGETVTLVATTSNGSGVVWSSSDPEIATVQGGVVTGVKEGTVTITAKAGNSGSATCEVTVTWAEKPTDYYEIVFSGEADSAADPGNWHFWNDQGWCGSNVTAEGEYANGTATFTWSGSSAVWFGFQMFYDNTSLTVGKQYELSMTINSATEGQITVNGNVIDLVVGNNNVKVYYTELEKNVNNESACSISIQAGVDGVSMMAANTLKISNISWTEYTPEKLATPTALTIGANKAISVTDTNGDKAAGFKVSFSQNGKVKYELTLQNGAIIDDTTMEDGTYDITVSAVGHGKYLTSDPSNIMTTYTVANGGVVYDIFEGVETAAVANPGKWYYWTEWEGIANATYDKGTVSFEVVNGGNWYSNQIFYKNSALTAGTTYVLTFTLTSNVTDQITVNGNVITPVIGDNQVEITYTEGGNNASFSLQAGINAEGAVSIAAAEFTITNITWTAQQAGGTTGIMNGEESVAAANPGKYVYWNDQNWCGSNVSVTEANLENGVVTLTWETTDGNNFFGVQLFYKNANNVAGKTYTLTLTINSTVAGNITVNGTVYTLVVGENKISVDYVEGDYSKDGTPAISSLDIQMGDGGKNTMVKAGTLVISNVAWTEKA